MIKKRLPDETLEQQILRRKEEKRRFELQTLEAMEFQPSSQTAQKIALCFLLHPDADAKFLATQLKLEEREVRAHFKKNVYIQSMRELAMNRVTNMIPKALRRLEEAMDLGTAESKLRAAFKVLENERVLGPAKVDVTLNDLRDRPLEELDAIIKESQGLPGPVIEGEEIR